MRALLVLMVTACLALPVAAELTLPAVFSEHMVIQQKEPVHIWGWADAGAKVKIRLGNKSTTAVTEENGRWDAELAPLRAGGPYVLNVQSGDEKIVFTDVLCGEVWICSGQSNMEWPLNRSRDALADMAGANDNELRHFLVKKNVSDERLDDVEATWQPYTTENSGGASAVAYFFGKRLREELGVPVGLLDTYWGGTPSESWTSQDTLSGLEVFSATQQRWDEAMANYPAAKEAYDKAMAEWEAAAAKAKEAGEEAPRKPGAPLSPDHPHRPSTLYNAMIAPLVPFSVQGAIWYQGESNAGRAYQYRTIFPAMIQDWRTQWDDDFSFYYVQLANFETSMDTPEGSAWAELREAQMEALKLDHTGQAVIIDIGNPDDIHPTNKEDVGNRLALNALAMDYGKDVEYSGPSYTGSKVDGGTMRLTFDHLGGGLVCPTGTLTGFTIAGEDGAFVPASATIDGDTVVVSSPDVASPVAVRYGWEDNPSCNLYNRVGLPASPFRTDDWPGITVDAR